MSGSRGDPDLWPVEACGGVVEGGWAFLFHWGRISVFWRPVQRSQGMLEGALSGSNVDLTCQWDFLFNGEEDVWEGDAHLSLPWKAF